MATGPLLERRLRQAHDDGFKHIVLDLRGLEFMDSTGITLLTRWSLDASRDGFTFSLVPGSERIQRLFDLTGLHAYFTFVDG
jgi:anti-sigma B factor antagonist